MLLKHDLRPSRERFYSGEKSAVFKRGPTALRGRAVCVLCESAVSGHQFTLPLKYFRIQLSLLVFILQGLWLRLER